MSNENRKIWLIGCLGLLGCAMPVDPAASEDDPELGVNTQAIMGGLDYVSCTPRERGQLRSGAITGRTFASSTAFAQCIDTVMRNGDGLMGPYRYQSGDRSASSIGGHVSNVLAASRSAYPAQVTCSELGPLAGAASYQGWMHTHSDWMSVDESYLAGGNSLLSRDVAGVLWHEAMHTQNYRHAGEDVADGVLFNTPGVSDTVPYIVYWCMLSVGARQSSRCSALNACAQGGRMAVPASYSDASAGCSCIRDPAVTLPSGVSTPEDRVSPVLDPSEAGDHFGETLARGDFDGDGFMDLAVGAPFEGNDAANTTLGGKVYVYHGTSFGQLYPDKSLDIAPWGSLPVSGDKFGAALAAADFDMDGYEDLAVGAPGRSSNTGRVYLFRGSDRGLVVARSLTQSGLDTDEAGDRFGAALVRRWTGTYWDLVVGAPGERIGSTGPMSGWVYVFKRASSALVVQPSFSFGQSGVDTDESNDQFGFSLAAGRIDNDVVDDIAVGAPGEDNSVGTAYTFASENGGATSIVRKYRHFAPAESLLAGHSVAIGRFLTPNWGAVAVGIPYWSFSTRQGGVAVYHAHNIDPEPGALRLRFSWRSPNDGAAAGISLAALPEVSSTTQNRLAVGAPGGSGVVQILNSGFDAMSLGPTIDQSGLGRNETGDAFGYALAVGQWRPFDQTELIVGTPGEGASNDPLGSGAAMVYRIDSHTFRPVQYHTQNE